MAKQDSKTSEKIREVEREVLDEEFKRFKLVHRPNDLAISQLLRRYAEKMRSFDLQRLGNNEFIGTRDYLRRLRRGVNECLRWLSRDLDLPSVDLPELTSEQFELEVDEFLDWGIKYGDLVVDHVVWTKDITVGKVDERSSTITFEYPRNFDLSLFFFSYASGKIELEDFSTLVTNHFLDVLDMDFVEWVSRLSPRLQGEKIPYSLERGLPSYQIVIDWVMEKVWPNLPMDYDLKGYSKKDFILFFSILFLQGAFFTLYEERLSKMFSQNHENYIQIISIPEDGMVRYLMELSGLSELTIQNLLADFTFDAKDIHATVYNQPFIKTKSGNVVFLAYFFSTLEPSRMIARAAKNKGNVYDLIVNDLSSDSLEEISQDFQSSGYEVFRETNIPGPDDNPLQPDLLVYDKDTQELLVIEYKYVLPPTNLRETISKFKNLQLKDESGVKKCQEYLRFARSKAQTVSEIIGHVIHPDNMYGLLLFRWPMPIPFFSQDEIGVTDWTSLKTLLPNSHRIPPTDIMEWVATRPDLKLQIDKMSIGEPTVEVGGWTYESKHAGLNEPKS